MANTGLLILTNPSKVTKLIPVIKKYVAKTLYIQYFPEKNILMSGNYTITSSQWKGPKGPKYAQTVANIYSATSSISSKIDIRVLLTSLKNPNLSIINTKRPVELVIFDRVYSKKEADTFIQDCLGNTSMGCKFITCTDEREDKENEENNAQEERMYKNVVLGGTFDRLHNGHKIFLSHAILHCTEKLTVGVTDTNMLYGKILWELIESCEKRIFNLTHFLEDVDSSVTYNVVPITDIYGPTKEDPTLEMIVVSEETVRGGEKVNELRIQKNLSKLDVEIVNLACDDFHDEHEESKISSSNQRIRLLGTRLQKPRTNGKPLKPYIIGLTGGIASGKSSVADKLSNLGAGLVNCDKITHDLYLPARQCYDLVVQHFGRDVLTPDGSIDRKALGDVVFNDDEKLNKLNNLVWPVILKEARKQIEALYSQGKDIIVMEAAVLIQAKWQSACHEIWTCIIPQAEAIKRVMERNKITEEEAKVRIRVQPSNVEQINVANVVFCTMWSHDVTLKQVETAWKGLLNYLSDQSKS